MKSTGWLWVAGGLALLLLTPPGCGDGGSEAVVRGVGAGCSLDDDCTEEGQACLDFKGGYCGVENCTGDVDCPDGSACVAHVDATNYCFLICGSKPQCNVHRSVEDEANCSSNIVFVDPDPGLKACVPPSG
jgi:hypothetical protein